jgi:hypoxanthine-guanine phosphoribosyltransferase
MSIPVVKHLNLPGRHVLIEESAILQRIQQVGREVQVYLDKHPMRTVFVGVLTGATRFTMTFIEELNPNSFTYDFVKVHRYKNSQEGGVKRR